MGGGHPNIISMEIHPDGKIMRNSGGSGLLCGIPVFVEDIFSPLIGLFIGDPLLAVKAA